MKIYDMINNYLNEKAEIWAIKLNYWQRNKLLRNIILILFFIMSLILNILSYKYF